MAGDNGNNEPERDEALKTYQSLLARIAQPSTSEGFKDLGITPLARQLCLTVEQTNGHWCSRCQGIWFGYTLEAECPVCGNRDG